MRTILILACLLTMVPLAAQNPDLMPAREELICNIRPAERDWLYYFHYFNRFDKAEVEYQFGEVEVETDGTISRINLQAMPTPECTQNGPGQGEQADLLPYGRSAPFAVPDEANSRVRFFRNLKTSGYCNPNPGGPDSSPSGGYAEWDIADRTEFVVQLVRTSDGIVLGTLDSAGMFPHSTPHSNPRYGTNAGQVMQSVAVPAAALGQSVYLQISARRYGPSPYGLKLCGRGHDWNISSYVNPSGSFFEGHDWAQPEYMARLLAYCDSVKAATGWLPAERKHFFFTPEAMEMFDSRYYNQTGANSYREIPPTGELADAPQPMPDNLQIEYAYQAGFLVKSITPNPGSGDVVEVEYKAVIAQELRAGIYNLRGKLIAELWQGSLAKGVGKLMLELRGLGLADGTYLLRMLDSAGREISSEKIVVAR